MQDSIAEHVSVLGEGRRLHFQPSPPKQIGNGSRIDEVVIRNRNTFIVKKINRGERIRTSDLLVPKLVDTVYLIDFAARLATLNYRKTRSERSSCTDFVLAKKKL